MKKSDVIKIIFNTRLKACAEPKQEKGLAFAPTNIALCKYWGKRDSELNLPVTSSLSVTLPDMGAMTSMTLNEGADLVILNDKEIARDTDFFRRIEAFLDLFRMEKQWHLKIDIKMNLPVAAGLASSASGFASLAMALNDFFQWHLTQRELSIIARLGSGSAARSLWTGFVEWHMGVQPDGMDSYAEQLPFQWSDLMIGIVCLSDQPKTISSREAMQRTVNTSILYRNWPQKMTQDMVIVRQALQAKNFSLLGGAVESNAMTMHATMMSSWPPICYYLPETIAAMQKVWELRSQGLDLYFTQDAGPNLKLLFLKKDKEFVRSQFANMDVVTLFE